MAGCERISGLGLVGIADDELIEMAGHGAFERGYDYYLLI